MSKSVERCCVKGCNSVSGKDNNLTFHTFPKPKKQNVIKTNLFGEKENVDKLHEWKKALKLDTVHPRMKVCSCHFKHSDYILPDVNSNRKRLKVSVVPSMNLPITPVEEETASRNKARHRRLIQRILTQQINTANQSSSFENQATECSTVNKEVENVDINNQAVMNEECQNAVVESVVIESEVRNNEDPVMALIEKSKKRELENKEVKFNFCDTLDTDEKLCTATGISTLKILNTIVSMIELVHKDKFDKRKLKTHERVILTYMKMKHNTSYRLLTLIFQCVSSQVCQKIFLETVQILNQCLSVAIKWPSREEISKNLPTCFQGFEDTRVVLDCTEVYIQQPKNLCCQLKTYSHYKGAATVKFMIGVSPAGSITVVSPAYGGRTSDSAIFSQSKLINLLEPGDGIMVDKGFLIDELCTKNRWKCIRPPFLQDKKQFSQTESIATSRIAAARVHVERVNQRIKVWSIVGSKMPAHLLQVAGEIMNVLCATVNLSDPILSDDKFMNID